MKQVLICLEKKEELKLDGLTAKQKELIALGKAILSADEEEIALGVTNALDEGVTQDEILVLLSWMIRDRPSVHSIMHLLKVLDYEEAKRKNHIDWIKDCKEE